MPSRLPQILLLLLLAPPARAGIQERMERWFGPKAHCPQIITVPEELSIELELPAREIHYRRYGGPQSELVVFLHGLCADSRTFDTVARSLSQYYAVLSVDHRGQGLTPAYGWNYSTTVLAKDLRRLITHLNETRQSKIQKIHLIGHSLGARVAVRFAALFPDLVGSVVIEDMNFSPRVVGRITPAHSMKLGFESAVEKMQRKCRLASLIQKPGLGGHLELWKALEDKEFVVDLFSSQANAEELRPQLRALRGKPVLVLQPDARARIVEEFTVGEMRESIPGLQHVKIENAGHDIHNDNPDAYLKTVGEFLENAVGKR